MVLHQHSNIYMTEKLIRIYFKMIKVIQILSSIIYLEHLYTSNISPKVNIIPN